MQNGYTSPTDIILDSELKDKFFSRWNTLETWLQLRSVHRNYVVPWRVNSTANATVMRADDVCVRSTFRHSGWCSTITFSMWIFSETKTCKHCQWYQKGSLVLVFRLHASWTWWYKFNISVNNNSRSCQSVPLFGSHFASKKGMCFIFLVCSLKLNLFITTLIPL